MKLKLIFTTVMLSSFQFFMAQNTTNDTIKLATKTTITTTTTVKHTIVKVAPQHENTLQTDTKKEA